mgnify:CR=1 FL=1
MSSENLTTNPSYEALQITNSEYEHPANQKILHYITERIRELQEELFLFTSIQDECLQPVRQRIEERVAVIPSSIDLLGEYADAIITMKDCIISPYSIAWTYGNLSKQASLPLPLDEQIELKFNLEIMRVAFGPLLLSYSLDNEFGPHSKTLPIGLSIAKLD